LHCSSISGTAFQRVTPDYLEGTPVKLHYGKFQNSQNIQLFIKANQNNADKTQLANLAVISSPISTTNMGDFKCIADKREKATRRVSAVRF
jgi:hypothetical protein